MAEMEAIALLLDFSNTDTINKTGTDSIPIMIGIAMQLEAIIPQIVIKVIFTNGGILFI